MSELQNLQAAFKDYILADNKKILDLVEAPITEDDAITRVNIYAHGYFGRLHEILGCDYPIIKLHLGDLQFEKLCRDFLNVYPSHYFTVGLMGERMAKFLSEHEAYQTEPYLKELAEFEWTLQAILERPDAPLATLADLHAIPIENWEELRFVLHPSVSTLQFNWNIVEIAHAANLEPPEKKSPQAAIQQIVLWRKEVAAYYHSINAAELYMLAQIQNGLNFAELCEGLCDFMPEDDVPLFAVEVIQRWLSSEMVTQIVT